MNRNLLSIFSKKICMLLCFLTCVLINTELYATILFDFEDGTNSWVIESGFTTGPVWNTEYSYGGSGSIYYERDFTHGDSGYARREWGTAPSTNLSSIFAPGHILSMWVRTPDDLVESHTWIKLEIFSRTSSWTWAGSNSAEGELSAATWYNLTLDYSYIADVSDVNDIGFAITSWNDDYTGRVYVDLVEILGTNSVPEPVKTLSATFSGIGAALTWQAPNNSDYWGVMIRYSTNDYPADETDGDLFCYKPGNRTQTDATNHVGLTGGKTYYYTVFAMNTYSNYSGTNNGTKASGTMTTQTNFQVTRFKKAEQEIVRYGEKGKIAYNAMKLYWKKPNVDLGFIDYKLYRAREPLTMANINNASAAGLTCFNISDGNVSSYIDKSLDSFADKYYYALLTVFGGIKKSLTQNVSSLTYDPDESYGWAYKNIKPVYIWKEAEDYTNISNCQTDDHDNASGGKLIEAIQSEADGAYIEYNVNLPADMINAYLYLRNASGGDYSYLTVAVDGLDKITDWAIEPKSSDWYTFNFQDTRIGDGTLAKGKHFIRVSSKLRETINLDGFFIYDNIYEDFEPENELEAGSIILPDNVDVKVREIKIDYNAKKKVMQDPYYTAADKNPLIKNPQAVSAYEIAFTGEADILFNKLLSLSLDYCDEDIPTGVREKDLKVFYWNGDTWHKIGGDLNTDENLVDVQINHLGLFALYAGKDDDIDFKWSFNPFAPNGQGDYQRTTMSFYLPEDAVVTIKLFNLSGQLIRTLIEQDLLSGPVSIEWDGRDDSERNVPVGIYIYQVEGINDKVYNGTITILR